MWLPHLGIQISYSSKDNWEKKKKQTKPVSYKSSAPLVGKRGPEITFDRSLQ